MGPLSCLYVASRYTTCLKSQDRDRASPQVFQVRALSAPDRPPPLESLSLLRIDDLGGRTLLGHRGQHQAPRLSERNRGLRRQETGKAGSVAQLSWSEKNVGSLCFRK